MIKIEMIEESINKIQKKHFISKQKSILLAEEKRLEKELKKDNEFPEYGDNAEANAEEVEEYTKRRGIEKQLSKELNDIKSAIKNIENNKYGICKECGQKIEQERLEIIPSAQTCAQCSKG